MKPINLTIERCAAAIAEVRERFGNPYIVNNEEEDVFGVYDDVLAGIVFEAGSFYECQAWIDREAARACVATLLPVSDEVRLAIYTAWEACKLPTNMDALEDAFTAGIQKITGVM